MKSKVKRLSKSTVSVILALLMLFSTMYVGVISTDAAQLPADGDDAVGAALGEESSEVGAKVDSDPVGANFTAGSTIYLDVSEENSQWWNDTDNGSLSVTADFYTGTTHATFQVMTKVNTSDKRQYVWETTVPSGTWDHVEFIRSKTKKSNWSDNVTVWNQTKGYAYDSGYNCFVLNGNGGDKTKEGTWAKYPRNYYIGGRFKYRASANAANFTYTNTTNGGWADTATNMQFTDEDGDGIYSFHTYATIAELSAKISVDDTNYNDPYFIVHTGYGKQRGLWFGYKESSGQNFQNNTSGSKLTLIPQSTADDTAVARLMKFNNTSSTSTDYVVLNFNPNTWEIYYTTETVDTSKNFYLDGCFRTYKSDNTQNTQLDWQEGTNGIPFVKVSDTLYKIETNATLGELSASIRRTAYNDAASQFFYIYDDDTQKSYSTSSANRLLLQNAYQSGNAVPLTEKSGSSDNMVFSGANASVDYNSKITLYLTYNASSGAMTLYYDINGTKTRDMYIGGRFRVKDASGNPVYTGDENSSSSWAFPTDKNELKFINNGDGTYSLNTNSTLAELSQNFTGNDNTPPVFLIHTGSGDTAGNEWYGGKFNNQTLNNLENYKGSNKANLVSYTVGNDISYLMRFNAASSSSTGKVTIHLDTNTNQIYYTLEPDDYVASVKVYLKDGTINGGVNGTALYGISAMGGTANTDYTVNTARTASSYYGIYEVDASKDSYIVTTQVNNYDNSGSGGSVGLYHDWGYAVLAYCVDGVTYMAQPANDSGLYTATIPVTDNIDEVTPIYYNTNIMDAGDYITVYADASELNGAWGDTISTYTWYYDAGGDFHYNLNGGHPGQPMLRDSSGKYYAYVSKYNYVNGVKQDYAISGIQFNNYNSDTVHSTLGKTSTGQQTYDFNDFKYMIENGNDIAQFSFQTRSGTSSFEAIANSNTTYYNNNHSSDTITVGNYAWEDLTGYDGQLIDIIGNDVTNASLDPLYVISIGYQNYLSVDSSGQYFTTWYVFDSSGNYVTNGRPSDFIPRTDTNTAAYTTVNTNTYKGHPVKIFYEAERDSRIDGHWVSTKTDTSVTAKVYVRQDLGSSYAEANRFIENSNAGSATVGGETVLTLDNRTTQVKLSAMAGNGYIFSGWYMVKEDTQTNTLSDYQLMDTEGSGATVTLDSNYVFVAAFEEVEQGTLVFTHEKYAGPGAEGGLGRYYVSARLTGDGVDDLVIAEQENSIKIENFNPTTYTHVYVTLKTVCSGYNTFIDWFENINGSYQRISDESGATGSTGTVSYTFDFDSTDIYDGGDLLISSFNFFSDIRPATADFELTYIYNDRFGNEKSYVVTGRLDQEYLTANGYSITDAKVYEKAPAIDDLYKDCKWIVTEAKVDKNGTKATIRATQTTKTHTVNLQNINGDGVDNAPINNIAYNSLLLRDASDETSFYEAAATDTQGNTFKYWAIKKLDESQDNSVENHYINIGKCYTRKFNFRIVEDCYLEAIYQTDDNKAASISNPTFSREQTESTDILYADFLVEYIKDSVIKLQTTDTDAYKTGVLIEIDPERTLSNDKTVAENYAAWSQEELTAIEAFLESDTKTAAHTVGEMTLYNFVIKDNSDYSNKNRLYYYVKFNNTEGNRDRILRAYYYVVDVANETVEISDPVNFNLKEIGTLTPVTGN